MASVHDHEGGSVFYTFGVRIPARKKITFAVKRRYDWSHWREIDFGGVVETAKALGIKSQSVSGWPDDVPELRAFQIEKITGGQLKADFKPAAQLQAS